jgi:hypothetical protein
MWIANNNVHNDIALGKHIKINIGSGETHLHGFYNLDLMPLDGIDIVADLNNPLDQLPDNCVCEIYSRHTFEHVHNIMGLMQEIHRIVHPGGTIQIIVPHFSNIYSFSDPTHVRFFGLYTMNYFVPTHLQPSKRKVPSYYGNSQFDIDSINIEFYQESRFERLFVPFFWRLVNRSFAWQEFYERRLSSLFHAWQIKYNLTPIKNSPNGLT